MVTGIYTKTNTTFIGSRAVDYVNKDGKRIQGVTLTFEDSNEVEGTYYVGHDQLDTVSYPDHRCTGTLYVKISEGKGVGGKPYTKVDFRKFVEEM